MLKKWGVKNTLALLTGTFILTGCGNSFAPVNKLSLLPEKLAPTKTQIFSVNTGPRVIPDQFIVKAKTTSNKLFKFLTSKGVKVLDSFDIDTPVYLIRNSSKEDITALKQHLDVDFVQEDMYLSLQVEPNDPLYKEQWSMKKINAEQAWTVTTGKQDIIVSVVDTGVDYNHPDLAGKVIKGKDFTKESDGTDPIDGFGHGTHVAGIIAATANNGVGVTGIAPGVKVMAVKVLSKSGGGSLFSIAGGITYSVKNGAKIVNLSLGGPAVADMISSAVGYWAWKKGVLLVAAAGNSGGPVGTPARIDDYYMAVGASDDKDDLAKFSCFGKELSVVSPGTNIMNTTPTYHVPLNDHGYAMNYAALNGTSMACPLVAGLAALVWSAHPNFNSKQVRAKIEKAAVDLGTPGKDNKFGYGRVDAYASVK